jgi:hypothetical protein
MIAKMIPKSRSREPVDVDSNDSRNTCMLGKAQTHEESKTL